MISLQSFVQFKLQHESTFEQVTDDELSNSQPVDVESGSFEIIQSR